MLPPCERCDGTENVKHFLHFDTDEREWLCWECRRPIVMERVHPDEGGEEEPSGQASILDY